MQSLNSEEPMEWLPVDVSGLTIHCTECVNSCMVWSHVHDNPFGHTSFKESQTYMGVVTIPILFDLRCDTHVGVVIRLLPLPSYFTI